MKYISVLILICLPIFIFGQKIKFKIGAGLNYSFPILNDIVNADAEGITRDELINGNYDWFFKEDRVNSIFSTYRESAPKFGLNINGIGNLYWNSKLSFRFGIDLQFTRFGRTMDRRIAIYDSYNNYQSTLELHQLNFTTPVTVLYLSLPIGLEYFFEKEKLSLFGGISFSSRIYDDNIDNSEAFVTIYNYPNSSSLFANPLLNDFFTSFNFGATYKINKRFNIELMYLIGISNILDTTWENKNIIWPNVTMETDKTNFNKQKSLLQQLSIGVSYELL